ncbi:MAG: hypothetical protein ACJ8HI_07465 [Massilia sp.]
MASTADNGEHRFDTRAGFGANVRAVLQRARLTLQLFDPDYSVWPLGQADVEETLRQFLLQGGAMKLALHRPGHIERECPRLMRLLRDFGHRIECRATPPGLQQLTDSFVIADGVHIARRFHSDHMRGEVRFDDLAATEISGERFAALWLECRPTLSITTTGL